MRDEEIGVVVVGVTEMVKRAGLPSRFCPLFAILLGLVIKLIETFTEGTGDYFSAGLRGLIIGLTATGLYGAVDGFVQKSQKPSHENFTEETY